MAASGAAPRRIFKYGTGLSTRGTAVKPAICIARAPEFENRRRGMRKRAQESCSHGSQARL
jgi:hypothetical protein